MKFDGTNWVNVGNAGFSAGEAYYENLVISTSGQPYVAFQDKANSYKSTVMKFDGTNWINVGNAGFSPGEADYTNLAFNPDGQLYIAFTDYGNYGSATVMKFDGNDWVIVGMAGFTLSNAVYPSLAFNPSGQPNVAYEDYMYSDKATVMYYNAPTGIKEQQYSQISIYPNPAIERITIEVSGTSKGSNLAIVNIEGQQFITRQITDTKTQLDISTLPSGVYFVRVTNDKTVKMGKIIKQ
jgi:WD40 repeat protein